MKVVILAGGYGTRLGEETVLKPKPMVEIGGKPILWHIMKIFSHYGFNEFIICLGYKGYIIKEYFSHYLIHNNDLFIDLEKDEYLIITQNSENWKINLIDTGPDTMTGGRIKRIQKHLKNEPFLLTYGDGVSDININELIKFHKNHQKIATVTAIQRSNRYGVMELSDNGTIKNFHEKPTAQKQWINAGFFVLEPKIFKYIEGDSSVFERDCMEELIKSGNLMAYKHYGFWKCMDILKEKNELEEMWSNKKAPWKIWND